MKRGFPEGDPSYAKIGGIVSLAVGLFSGFVGFRLLTRLLSE